MASKGFLKLIIRITFNFLCEFIVIPNLIILLNMKNSKVVIKDQTTEFIQTLTDQLNGFFNKISKHGYSFECVHTPNHSDDRAIQIKKAYRVFKKFLINEKLIDPELGEKARERFASRVWEQLNESQKLKYFTTKHFPPIHYLQKLVANVAQRRQPKQQTLVMSPQKQKVPSSKLQQNGSNGSTPSKNLVQNKKVDKNSQIEKPSVVVIQ